MGTGTTFAMPALHSYATLWFQRTPAQ